MAEQQSTDRRFPSTRWSMLDRAASEPRDGPRTQLGEVILRYTPALREHLTRRRGVRADRADDFIQGFVADKVLDKDFVAQADSRKGKFRSYLLTSLDRYVISQGRQASARKRSPVSGPVQVLDERLDTPHQNNDVDPFDVAWARQIIRHALDKMRQRCESDGRIETWHVFRLRIAEPILEGAEPLAYEELMQRFSFASYGQATKALHRAKGLYVACLREVVGEYVHSSAEVDDEIDDLMQILSRGGG